MILTGKEIEKRLGYDIIITPYDSAQLNPNSYNLTLHNKLLVYSDYELDMYKDNKTNEISISPSGLVLKPGTLYLGRTKEFTETYNLVPVLDGRSSIGRLGISIHVTAGYGDNGFRGYWTLEISCIKAIKIYPNAKICQIRYHTIIGNTIIRYKGKYQDNSGIQSSKLFMDKDYVKKG